MSSDTDADVDVEVDVAARLAAVRARLLAAAVAAGRDPATVRLLAASKTRPPEEVRAALAAGQTLFGENRAQELRDKHDALLGEPLEWHFIGALQRNKVKYVVGRAALIHSVDSEMLAEAINERCGQLRAAGEMAGPVGVLVQINVGEEGTKAGSTVSDSLALARRVQGLPHLSLRGLMAIPPYTEDPWAAAPYFAAMAALAAEGRAAGLPLEELSMGMSHDLEVAVAHGATLVRVGTAIFGARPPLR